MNDPFLNGIMRRMKVREEMADTKPTLEEQINTLSIEITEAAPLASDEPVVLLDVDDAEAILASLKELQSIRSAEMPVEPVFITVWRQTQISGTEQKIVKHIDALKAYALKWQNEADGQFQCAGRLLEQLNKAESELAALRARLMEPDEEMIFAGSKAFDYESSNSSAGALDVWSAMTAVALKEVGNER